MTCKHWRQEDSFCVQKGKTINFDELSDCAETCLDFSPSKKLTMMKCTSCSSEFPLTENNRVEVKNKEYIKCSSCGAVVNLKRNDGTLRK